MKNSLTAHRSHSPNWNCDEMKTMTADRMEPKNSSLCLSISFIWFSAKSMLTIPPFNDFDSFMIIDYELGLHFNAFPCQFKAMLSPTINLLSRNFYWNCFQRPPNRWDKFEKFTKPPMQTFAPKQRQTLFVLISCTNCVRIYWCNFGLHSFGCIALVQ